MTERCVCIHAHFYQPPRENPWLEEVEIQHSAYPHHDWNERISAECYAPNAASRIMGGNRKILDIVNNYARISFNFGPTLLTWMERRQPELYAAIIEADRQSREIFSGHGSALAQVYNHVIMPLADARDKRTQVVWGAGDFEKRFGRRPEGMWLAETAVDIDTLEVLADEGIAFTILAQHQAARFRSQGDDEWQEVNGGSIDPRMPYLCNLPSGRSIAIFFYDGPIAHDIAFGDLLDNGERFAARLMDALDDREGPQLVHVATDGETYGHHHRFGDMALAYCLHRIEAAENVRITIYGEHLEKFPPTHEVEIAERTSWSCAHGIERWRSDCGCSSGGHQGWGQAWRAPLRGALDWLKEGLDRIYSERMGAIAKDPWALRDEYISVVLDRSSENVDRFLGEHLSGPHSPADAKLSLKLLEMQRHAMLMYTSCGWFFDEISGIETVEVLRCAARAMQLAQEASGIDLEPSFAALLARAPSNVAFFGDGASVYEQLVKPAVVNMLRVGVHYAVSSLFEDYPETARIYCYEAQSVSRDLSEMGRQKLLVGRARLRSTIVRDEETVSFAVMHLGDHNISSGVRPSGSDEDFEAMRTEMREIFMKGDLSQAVLSMDKHFGTHSYSLWHLFKDEQRKVLSQVLGSTMKEAESAFRQIYDHHFPALQVMQEAGHPLPRPLAVAVEFVLNTDFLLLLEQENLDLPRLERLGSEIRRWSVNLDERSLSFAANRRLNGIIEELGRSPEMMQTFDEAESFLRVMRDVGLSINPWKAQNIHFELGRSMMGEMHRRAEGGDAEAQDWIKRFESLGDALQGGGYR